MPVSGRRHQALQADYAQLLKNLTQLHVELREVTEERDAARDVVRGLADRNRELIARPATKGEAVLLRLLRQSEGARRLLAEQVDLLQAANEGAAREAYDLAAAARQAVAA
ncbi:hypothetical protein ACGFXC_09025 [Streptomyces sp. NPDC048507]|uniref:hypothetical protein n=1 Tax=Streptomyces sp. NPDC048507 TaxID=3365560 RepID=UPI0037136DFB